MDRKDVEDWLERYVGVWTTNDPGDIGTMFTEDATYYTAPFREPWAGREAIVAGWLDRKDDPGAWTFKWQILAIEDDLAFVRGETNYPNEAETYSNLWVIRLRDGRCSEFTEWWMQHP